MLTYLIVGEALFLLGLLIAPMRSDARRIPLGPSCAAAAVTVVLWPLLVLAMIRGVVLGLRRIGR